MFFSVEHFFFCKIINYCTKFGKNNINSIYIRKETISKGLTPRLKTTKSVFEKRGQLLYNIIIFK
jgi:hypothetical protein